MATDRDDEGARQRPGGRRRAVMRALFVFYLLLILAIPIVVLVLQRT